jgi:hypothetical protein
VNIAATAGICIWLLLSRKQCANDVTSEFNTEAISDSKMLKNVTSEFNTEAISDSKMLKNVIYWTMIYNGKDDPLKCDDQAYTQVTDIIFSHIPDPSNFDLQNLSKFIEAMDKSIWKSIYKISEERCTTVRSTKN